MEYKFCAIDAEGDSGERGLLGVAFYSDVVQEYLTEKEPIKAQLLYHALAGYTFLCHNAEYDIPVIFWQLKIPVKVVKYNGRFNRGEWRSRDKGRLTQIWDTVGISGGLSLEKLGHAIKLPKYQTPQRLRGLDADRYNWICERHGEGECESCYALRDAEITYRFMEGLGELLAGWGVQPQRRIAGISMATWKVLDQPKSIRINDRKINLLGRKAYAGGRCETPKLGYLEHIHMADICSAYPAAMLETLYPDPHCMIYDENKQPDQVNWNLEGVADVDITVPFMHMPPLPYTSKGIRTYPCGRFRGCWTLFELRYAASIGCRINFVYRAAYSLLSCSPFPTFIGTMWELRATYERDADPRGLFAKLLMNNLYGRIGMRERITRSDTFAAPPGTGSKDWSGHRWDKVHDDYYLTKETHQKFRNEYANVLWAAQTTAAVRVKLHKLLVLQGQNLIYCDTDSVFSTAPIIGLGEGLGALRDPKRYEAMIVCYPKTYAVKTYAEDMDDEWRYAPCEPHHVMACELCQWEGKVKGVQKGVAMEFIRTGSASFRKPVKVGEMGRRDKLAGEWVEVARSQQVVDHRRHPINPAALDHEYGWSDTVPDILGTPAALRATKR